MGWGHPGSPAQSPWGGRPCWSPPYLRWARPHCSGTAALHHHVWDTATTCTQERTNLLSTHATGGTLCLCNWMVALGGSQKPCASLPSYCSSTGEQQPPPGGAGSPPCREAAGAVVIPARAAAAAHKASAQGRALVFEKSQNRARAEPPLQLWGCARRAPRALGGGTWKIGDVPGLLTSSPMLGHHLLQTSPGGPTVSPCHGSAEPAGRERDPQPPAPQRHRDGKAPGVLGEGEQRGRGAVGPGFVPAAPQHPPHHSSPSGQEEQSCSAHAGHGPSHSPTCPSPQLVMLGWILRWEKHPDPPQTPVGCRKKGAEPHGSHP